MPAEPPGIRPWVIRVALVVAIAMTAVGVAILAGNGSNARGGPGGISGATSTQPESFVLPALHGDGLVSLAGHRGSPLVVTFFASWCTACRGELPGMARVSRRLTGRVTFAGVNSRENGDGYAMASQFGITSWPLARDVGGVQNSGLHDALNGQGMPITAFYDAAGHVLGVSYAALSEDALNEKLHQYYGVGP